MEREAKQRKLLLRWVQYATDAEEEITDLAAFQDGSLLTLLMERLSGQKAPHKQQRGTNKHTLIVNLQNALKFAADQGVRVTCAPLDIYNLKEDALLGLLWVLILRYQVDKKSDVLAWAALLTQKTLFRRARPQVTDFDKSWQDGVAFAALVNGVKQKLVDLDSLADDRPALLESAFRAAEDELGVPRLLDPSDAKLDERGITIYLSIFYSKYSQVLPSKQPDDEVLRLRARVKELETGMVEAEQKMNEANELSVKIVIKSGKDLAELTEQMETMQEELDNTREENTRVNLKVRELTLKMPFFMQNSKKQEEPPEGNVTLVFTDVQGSTEQWESQPEAMASSLAIHNAVAREAISQNSGYEVKTEGDAFMVAFRKPADAVQFCLDVQSNLLKANWPEEIYESRHSEPETVDEAEIYRGLRVRMGVHCGEPKHEADPITGRMDYFGPMVNRTARVTSAAAGGQVIATAEVWEAIKADVEAGSISLAYKDLGYHSLKDIPEELHLAQILPCALAKREFPAILTPVELKRADLASEFAALQLTNSELKARFVQLQDEAAEAAAKAEELQQWLKEMAENLPTSLADDLEIMAANLAKLVKSQANLVKELLLSQRRLETSEESIGVLERRLDEALVEAAKLAVTHKQLLSDCARLEKECTAYELENLEREMAEARQARNIISKLRKHSKDIEPDEEELLRTAEERKQRRRKQSATPEEEMPLKPAKMRRVSTAKRLKSKLKVSAGKEQKKGRSRASRSASEPTWKDEDTKEGGEQGSAASPATTEEPLRSNDNTPREETTESTAEGTPREEETERTAETTPREEETGEAALPEETAEEQAEKSGEKAVVAPEDVDNDEEERALLAELLLLHDEVAAASG